MMLHRNAQEPSEPQAPQPCGAIGNGAEEEMPGFRDALLGEVQKSFVMPADGSVAAFLAEHRGISQTLLETAPRLKECFGADALFKLEAATDEAGSRTLYAVAIWPGNVLDARAALAKFDDWWLAQARQGAGFVTFTYELV